jgi:GWxTD domain-containing protein
LVDVPVVAGFLRPAIFVPASLFTGMPADQLEYLLIHELAHIRRFDYAVNLVQKAVEGLLFYHPAVWWVSRILQTERENCCDDAVVAMHGNAREYASVLASLEQSRMDPAMAASGGQLSRRIFRLMNRHQHLNAAPVFAAIAIAMTAAFAWSALQQPAPPAADPYSKWVTEDVAYIIQAAERAAFQRLTTNEERDHFIEQFWERRNPVPGSARNDFKEEHYRRIGLANTRFSSKTLPGWRTDRGRIYITYGPPDEIDSHPAEFFESWKYRWIEGIGNNVMIDFKDTNQDGTYPMTKDPNR